MTEPTLLFRIMTEVDGRAQADDQLAACAVALRPFGTCAGESVEQYGKIPAYWVLTFQFVPVEPARLAFEKLLALAPEGWYRAGDQEDPWAVWDSAPPGVHLLTDRVRWAELTLVHP